MKLTNGVNIRGAAFGGITGLTIVSENPVYVQGDWNANSAGTTGSAVRTRPPPIIAGRRDVAFERLERYVLLHAAVQPGRRVRARAANSWYRLAIIAGKGPAFPQPNGTAPDFGTDGGAHNFLRYLEGGGGTVNYRGSIATFFFNRQAVGTYKCCGTVYNAPTRAFAFDIDFLQPALLPPNTPVFRDMNAVGFAQEMRPGR